MSEATPPVAARQRWTLDVPLLERVLRPYRSNCRYLHDATLEFAADRRPPRTDDQRSWIVLHGNCSIPASCYIDDTGHFNAVELNITYNQMLYACMAGFVHHQLVPELRHWSLEVFWQKQLPDVLILDYRARFPRPLDPRAFRGRFELREVIQKPHKRMVLLMTACGVDSDDGGHAEAEVVIALVKM